MKNIISISGTHGVGKTCRALSLAIELKKENPRKTVGVLTENAVDCPFPINRESTLLGSVLWLITSQFQRELEASLKYDIVVSDRCVLDPIAYGMVLFGPGGMLRGAMEMATEHYRHRYLDVVILKAAENNYLFADGLRDVDLEFRAQVEKTLLDLHSRIQQGQL